MTNDRMMEDAMAMDEMISVCFGSPRGDELPQVAGADDIAVDLFQDITALPRDQAYAFLHHQIDDASIN